MYQYYMCQRLETIIENSKKTGQSADKLIQYILGHCTCQSCQKIDSQVKSVLFLRNALRKKLNHDNLISRRLKSISDKEIDYRIKKWMSKFYLQMIDHQTAIQFIEISSQQTNF